MSRNKYPEETVQKILDISFRLFMQQGYEQTTIADIVSALGMSKGAVYHHFSSKEEILKRCSMEYYNNSEWFDKIAADKTKTGLERLRETFQHELSNEEKKNVDLMILPLLDNPQILISNLKATFQQGAPLIEQLILEGLEDGSLTCSYPREAAEVILLLANFWISLALFPVPKDMYLKRLCFFRDMLAGVGLPLMDEDTMKIAETYYDEVLCHMELLKSNE